MNPKNVSTKTGRNDKEVPETRVTRYSLNTILGGFVGGGEISSSRKRYVRSIMHVHKSYFSEKKKYMISLAFQDGIHKVF